MKKTLVILIAVLSVFMIFSFAVSAEEPSVDTYGVKITVNGLDDVRDFFIAKGEFDSYKEIKTWASQVVQWIGIHLPMQRTQVRSLVREDPIY